MSSETSKHKPSNPSFPSYPKCEKCTSLVLITKIDSFKNYIDYKCEFCSKYIQNYDIYNFMKKKKQGKFLF